MTTVTMNGNGSRRAELAAFLRSRRERITPEQVGLAPGLRRRTPRPLGAVAQTLRLDPTERQHLYRLADVADGAARPGLAGNACEQVPADVQGIIDGLAPLPGSVMNERYDLLGWNEAYAVLWPGVVGAQPGERNILWQNFTYPDCCHPYVTRHEQLARLVAQFRSNYGRHVGEPAWTGLLSAL